MGGGGKLSGGRGIGRHCPFLTTKVGPCTSEFISPGHLGLSSKVIYELLTLGWWARRRY